MRVSSTLKVLETRGSRTVSHSQCLFRRDSGTCMRSLPAKGLALHQVVPRDNAGLESMSVGTQPPQTIVSHKKKENKMFRLGSFI